MRHSGARGGQSNNAAGPKPDDHRRASRRAGRHARVMLISGFRAQNRGRELFRERDLVLTSPLQVKACPRQHGRELRAWCGSLREAGAKPRPLRVNRVGLTADQPLPVWSDKPTSDEARPGSARAKAHFYCFLSRIHRRSSFSGSAPSASAMVMNSMTSRRRSPPSYLAMKDCGLRSFLASAC